MYSQIIYYIKQWIEISKEDIEETLKYSDFKKFGKGDYILRAGEHCLPVVKNQRKSRYINQVKSIMVKLSG